eukprot:jgi/Galph1/1079/GphlegSOOS_G5815.1
MMSATLIAVAIVGSVVLSCTFAVVVIIVRKRMEVSNGYTRNSRSEPLHLQRVEPLVNYLVLNSSTTGLFQKDIDDLCKEYAFDTQDSPNFVKETSPANSSESSTISEGDFCPDDSVEQKPILCCICLEELERNCLVRTLPCQHTFHSKEICRWLSKRALCPYCRASYGCLHETVDSFLGNTASTDGSELQSNENSDLSTIRVVQGGAIHENVAVRSLMMLMP